MIHTMDAAAFDACIAAGGVAVFPSDTVYGLACDPESAAAVERMYALKGRPPDKPSAVMYRRVLTKPDGRLLVLYARHPLPTDRPCLRT